LGQSYQVLFAAVRTGLLTSCARTCAIALIIERPLHASYSGFPVSWPACYGARRAAARYSRPACPREWGRRAGWSTAAGLTQ